MENRLVVENIDVGYGSIKVLHDVSMTLDAGETVVLLGTNGNGKSTLIKSIMGLVPPTSGRILLEMDGDQTDLTRMRTEEIVNLGLSLVPEGRRLFPFLTVQENLIIGSYPAAARGKRYETLDYCYRTFPILKERKQQLAGTMSGGEQQMLAIARGIMSNPKILLIDEPSVGLAPIFVAHVMEKIKELKQRLGLTVLMTEQNFTQAIKIADRGYILVEGRIEFEGKTKEGLSSHELVRKFYLGA